jgi:deoxyribodipyrimidine photo-lyase
MVDAAVRSIPGRRFEVVDSNGLLPLRAADRPFTTAHSFRRFLQKTLPGHLEEFPEADPLKGAGLEGTPRLPREVRSRWPRATQALLEGRESLLRLPIDHRVGPVETRGGSVAAAATLKRFLEILPRYAGEHGAPQADVTSHLSPYLHFGHIGVHAVFHAVMRCEDWTPHDLASKPNGAREGWWGVRAAAESFLDELVTWRELGFNFCAERRDYDRYESLPDWARGTLEAHASDRREHLYTLRQFEAAATHDPLWNAAQRQLVREGRIHNYLRMLWGKKILEWTRSPRQALDIMIELNNKWALDGRDPNSYSGIFWVLGRFDRPWAPERPVFGSVRWMSSANTARKYRVREYVQRYGAPVAAKTLTG